MSDENIFLPGHGGAAITALQILSTALSYFNEKNPETRAQYSKFSSAQKTMVSSQTGMLCIYMPALVISTLCQFLPQLASQESPVRNPAIIMLIIHFAKRVLEVLFLHIYSGSVGLALSSTIGTYYALISYLICCIAKQRDSQNVNTLSFGFILFTIGIVGNFYHHYILADLRKSASTKKYIAPRGCLFEYVAAPHYLFELIGWLGIATVSRHLNAYLVFATMTSYLSGRAVSQNEWNMEQFDKKEWPKTRLNLVPGLF